MSKVPEPIQSISMTSACHVCEPRLISICSRFGKLCSGTSRNLYISTANEPASIVQFSLLLCHSCCLGGYSEHYVEMACASVMFGLAALAVSPSVGKASARLLRRMWHLSARCGAMSIHICSICSGAS